MATSGSMQVELLSPSRVMTRVSADRVTVPGINGDLGILPSHTALVSELGVGVITVSGGELSEQQQFFVAGGYVEVSAGKVTVLADTVEKRSEIDVARAEKSKQRALEILSKRDGEVDYSRAQAALKRAEQRLAFASAKKH